MILPPDIVDNTIAFLYDDPSSLKACSLTCRAWLPTTRIHLFSFVDLSDNKFSRFQRILQQSPRLGRFVKAL
ncbi:hypothetical protein OBBRIDRAFT_718887, partial [Obba rivulosa]